MLMHLIIMLCKVYAAKFFNSDVADALNVGSRLTSAAGLDQHFVFNHITTSQVHKTAL